MSKRKPRLSKPGVTEVSVPKEQSRSVWLRKNAVRKGTEIQPPLNLLNCICPEGAPFSNAHKTFYGLSWVSWS